MTSVTVIPSVPSITHGRPEYGDSITKSLHEPIVTRAREAGQQALKVTAPMGEDIREDYRPRPNPDDHASDSAEE